MVQEVKPGFFVSDICKGCTARDRAGNNLREITDMKRDSGESIDTIRLWLEEQGWLVSQQNLNKHFNSHSPYINKKHGRIISARKESQIKAQIYKQRNAEEELQKLVNIGADRVDKGEILVDKELYMFALDRKTKTAQPMTIQNLIMNFGESLVESKRELEEVKALDIT